MVMQGPPKPELSWSDMWNELKGFVGECECPHCQSILDHMTALKLERNRPIREWMESLRGQAG